MASLTDDQSFQYALKLRFPNGIPWNIYADENAPFLMLLDKDANQGGEDCLTVIEYASISGRSTDPDVARANKSGQEGARIRFPWREDYAMFGVNRKTMLAAKGNQNAIVDAWDRTMKHAESRIKRSLAQAVVGDGSGALGRVKSVTGTTTLTITFEMPASAVLLERNDVLQANPNKTGNVGNMRAGTGKVLSVNRKNGVITVTALSSFAPQVNDYLYIEGDYGRRIIGVQGWIPAIDPVSGENFGGEDRSVDPTRLAGIRDDQSSAAGIIDAIQSSMGLFRREGATPSHIFVSQDDFNIALKEAESRRMVTEPVVNEYEVAVRGIRIGNALLVGDMYFPSGYAYPLKMDTWTLKSLGEAPHIIDDDGLEKRRDSTGDSFSGEMAYYAQVSCDEPGQNGVITLPSVR